MLLCFFLAVVVVACSYLFFALLKAMASSSVMAWSPSANIAKTDLEVLARVLNFGLDRLSYEQLRSAVATAYASWSAEHAGILNAEAEVKAKKDKLLAAMAIAKSPAKAEKDKLLVAKAVARAETVALKTAAKTKAIAVAKAEKDKLGGRRQLRGPRPWL